MFVAYYYSAVCLINIFDYLNAVVSLKRNEIACKSFTFAVSDKTYYFIVVSFFLLFKSTNSFLDAN